MDVREKILTTFILKTKMNDPQDLIELTSRDDLLFDLALARYGNNTEPIGVSTFYRWAKELGIKASKTHYSGCEKKRFQGHAQKLRADQLSRRPPIRRKTHGHTIC